jgi:hypothetical protein
MQRDTWHVKDVPILWYSPSTLCIASRQRTSHLFSNGFRSLRSKDTLFVVQFTHSVCAMYRTSLKSGVSSLKVLSPHNLWRYGLLSSSDASPSSPNSSLDACCVQSAGAALARS